LVHRARFPLPQTAPSGYHRARKPDATFPRSQEQDQAAKKRKANMKQAVAALAGQPADSATNDSESALRQEVHNSVEHYFDNMGGESVTDLHRLVMSEVESTLLANIMHRVGNNQSKAAAMLGINRSTLRTRLRQYRLV